MTHHPNAAHSGHDDLNKAAQRSDAKNPISDAEVPYLEILGAVIRTARLQAHLTVKAAATEAELHHLSWCRLEAATRRTRSVTLGRIAQVLAPKIGLNPDVFHRCLIDLAGPALGDEKARTWHLAGSVHA